VTTKGIKVQDAAAIKAILHRIVAMPHRMALIFDGVAKPGATYDAVIGFPNLRELYVRDWLDGVPEHDVTLETGVVSAVKIVLE
jgi:hypothetical protein